MSAVHDRSGPRRRPQLFEQLLEFAPDGIVGVDGDGRIALVNTQTEKLFGYSREDLIGRQLESLIPERYRGGHPTHRAGYFANSRTRPMGADLELFAMRSDGSEFPAEISLSSIETAEGVLAIAAIRDITERRQIELEKQALEAELAEARRVEVEGEKRAMEAQLNQLRRLESVGQLAASRSTCGRSRPIPGRSSRCW